MQCMQCMQCWWTVLQCELLLVQFMWEELSEYWWVEWWHWCSEWWPVESLCGVNGWGATLTNMLHHTKLHHTKLYHTKLYHTKLYHIKLYHTKLYHTKLYHTKLYNHSPNLPNSKRIGSDFRITPVKSGFNTVRLTLRFTWICSELNLRQIWASFLHFLNPKVWKNSGKFLVFV